MFNHWISSIPFSQGNFGPPGNQGPVGAPGPGLQGEKVNMSNMWHRGQNESIKGSHFVSLMALLSKKFKSH